MTPPPSQNAGHSRHLWDPQDLIRRLCNALEIAGRAVRLLAPLGYQDPADPAVGVTAEKVVSETALLLLACHTLAARHAEINSRLREVVSLLLPHARNEQVLIALCLNPGLARDYTFAHACLSRMGFPDAQFDRVLRLSLTAEAAGGRERLPHRTLEQEWLKRVWSPPGAPSGGDSAVAARSMLGQPFDIFASSRDDIYAFTHAVMYLSDLGERRVRLPRLKSETLAQAEGALACCLDQQDYDLCGELLLSWPYLGARWCATATFAFQVLARVEDEVGFLPAPLTRLDRYNSLGPEERPRYAMATVYHTAYVMGLLCAASLKPGRTPPAAGPRPRPNGVAGKLLEVIDADGSRPHWRDDLSRLEAGAQDALAPLLMTVALKRAVASRNLGRVRTLLAYGLDKGIVNYPATRQAADLLRRIAETARYSTARGVWPCGVSESGTIKNGLLPKQAQDDLPTGKPPKP